MLHPSAFLGENKARRRTLHQLLPRLFVFAAHLPLAASCAHLDKLPRGLGRAPRAFSHDRFRKVILSWMLLHAGQLGKWLFFASRFSAKHRWKSGHLWPRKGAFAIFTGSAGADATEEPQQQIGLFLLDHNLRKNPRCWRVQEPLPPPPPKPSTHNQWRRTGPHVSSVPTGTNDNSPATFPRRESRQGRMIIARYVSEARLAR